MNSSSGTAGPPPLTQDQVDAGVQLGLLLTVFPPFRNLTVPQVGQAFIGIAGHLPNATNVTLAGFLGGHGPLTPDAPPGSLTMDSVGKLVTAAMASVPHGSNIRHYNVAYITLICVTTVVFALRMFTRRFIRPKKLSMEDWLMVAAWALSVATCGMFIAVSPASHWGLGFHIYDVSFNKIVQDLKFILASRMALATDITLVNYSILVFFYRLSPQTVFRRCVMVTGICVTLWYLLNVFTTVFQCKPIGEWNFGKCQNRVIQIYFIGIIRIVLDLVTLALPIPLVWNLQLNKREKLIVTAIFASGIFAALTGVLRLIALPPAAKSPDLTYAQNVALFYGILEIDISIICACVPALKAFVGLYAPKILGYHSKSSSQEKEEEKQRSPDISGATVVGESMVLGDGKEKESRMLETIGSTGRRRKGLEDDLETGVREVPGSSGDV